MVLDHGEHTLLIQVEAEVENRDHIDGFGIEKAGSVAPLFSCTECRRHQQGVTFKYLELSESTCFGDDRTQADRSLDAFSPRFFGVNGSDVFNKLIAVEYITGSDSRALF